MFAAPFNNDNNDNNDNEIINKKKQAHNKTQKIYPKENFDTNKVKSVLEKIHGNNNDNTIMKLLIKKNKHITKHKKFILKRILTQIKLNLF